MVDEKAEHWTKNHDWLVKERERERKLVAGKHLETHRCASTMSRVGQNDPKKVGVGGPFSHSYAIYKIWEHNGSMGPR